MWKHFITCLAGSALVSAAAINSSLVSRVPKPDLCQIAEAAPDHQWVGGPDGALFCESHWPNIDFITGLETYVSENDGGKTITGLKVTYASGEESRIGRGFNTRSVQKMPMALAPGEYIKSGWIRGNGNAQRVGSFEMVTSAGVTLTFGNVQEKLKAYPMDPGSGFLIAITGAAGSEIDSLDFLFLGGKLKSIKTSNIVLDDDITKQGVAFSPQAISKMHYFNDGSSNMTINFGGSSDKTSTHAFTHTSTISFGMELKVEGKVKVPFVSEFTIGLTTKLDTTNAFAREESVAQKVAQTFSISQPLLPGKGLDCEAWYAEGNGDFPYSADVNVDMGSIQLKYRMRGMLKSVMYSEASARCKDVNTKEIPEGFRKGCADGKQTLPNGQCPA